MKDIEEISIQNPEPYNLIYNYLRFTVLPRYPCLTSVFQDNFDEEGNPYPLLYMKFISGLSKFNGKWIELLGEYSYNMDKGNE